MQASAVPRPRADTARVLRDRVRQRMNYELDRWPEREKLLRLVEILVVESRREGVLLFLDTVKTLYAETQGEAAGPVQLMDHYFQGKLNAYTEVCELAENELGNL